ncbi:MAG: iron-sulfur cluster assembly scaffold protein [Firmicutes bacterium]|nr:iron-sulfur cluster assembly scaffold protein [Bacillota bacterium]
MYSDNVMERFRAAKNAGTLKGANGRGEVGNVTCGDIMRMYLLVDTKTDIIRDAKFKTFGCVAAIVSTDIACDLIKGKTIEEALLVKNTDVIREMGGSIPPKKIHCSVLAQESIEAAIADYKKFKAKLETK